MFSLEIEGITCGIVPRTYERTICDTGCRTDGDFWGASNLWTHLCRAALVRRMPVPCLVAVTRAIRDEGTSYHSSSRQQWLTHRLSWRGYLNLSSDFTSSCYLRNCLDNRCPLSRNTRAAQKSCQEWSACCGDASGIVVCLLFGASFPVGMVAHVTNSSIREGKGFDKGDSRIGIWRF